MKRTTIQPKQDNGKLSSQAIKFVDQGHLDWWNAFVKSYELPLEIDRISIWKLTDKETDQPILCGFQLNVYNQKTKKFITLAKEKFKTS